MRVVTDWVEDSKTSYTDRWIKAIIHDVNQLEMTKVLSHYGVKFVKTTGNRAYAMCPFHVGKNHVGRKLGSFSVSIGKNLCFCFACQKGGSNVASYQTLFNCDEKTAALQIACDFGLITKEEFEKLSDVEYVKTEAKYDFQKYVKPKPVYQDEVLKVRTDTYEFMRDYFGLTDEDREVLEKKRALEPERINADYFSIDTKSNPNKVTDFCAAFTKRFPEYASEMASIPGFFEHKNKLTNSWKPSIMLFDGIGILIRDANGKIPGVQIRMKNLDVNGLRYKFMSYDYGDGSKGYNRGGCSCGTPIDVVYPDNITKDTMVCLAEGRFKAEILRQQGCIGISVQGVNNFNGIDLTLNAIEAKIGRQIKRLYIFYDADMVENPSVFKALMSLAQYLDEEKPGIDMYQMVWRMEAGKGIDDCILAGNRAMVRPIAMSKMKEIYDMSIKEATVIAGLEGVKPIDMTVEDRENFINAFQTLVCGELFP